MTPEFAIWVTKQTVYTALLISAPMLLAGLVVGLLISIFQAMTQIHEITLTYIPKILAVVVVMIFTMPWMINIVCGFTRELFSFIAAGMV
jgi:flagellar biosynthetic protein FliQ